MSIAIRYIADIRPINPSAPNAAANSAYHSVFATEAEARAAVDAFFKEREDARRILKLTGSTGFEVSIMINAVETFYQTLEL